MARWHTWLNSSGCPQEYYSATTRPLLLLLSQEYYSATTTTTTAPLKSTTLLLLSLLLLPSLPSNPPSLPLCGPSTAQTTSRLSTSRTTAQNTRNLCGKVNAIPFLPSYDLMTLIAPDSSAPQSCQGGKGLSDKSPKHLPSRTILR